MHQRSLKPPPTPPNTTRYELSPAEADHPLQPFRLQEVRLSFTTSERPAIRVASPQDVVAAFADLRKSVREQFYALFLNGANEVIAADHISTGNIAGTSADTAEIMRTALLTGARGIIVLHNHPSGTVHPSREDIAVTQSIRQAAKLFSITLLDHVVIGRNEQYYSFAEHKQLVD